MSTVGALLGALAAAGALLVVVRVQALRRPSLQARVLPFVRDLPAARPAGRPETPAAVGVFGPVLQAAADAVERVLGGSASVRRRLERLGSDGSVHEFRVEQVLWGLGAFAIAAAYGLLRTLHDPGAVTTSALLCVVAFVTGVLARDNRLSGAR
jgi:tight adherence protein C